MKRIGIGLVACVLALPVEAQTGVALAGVEGASDTHSAYLGTVRPLRGSALGRGWVQRYWLDYTGYRYEKLPGEDVDAKVAGAEAALGYQDGSQHGWWSVYLGARYAHTRLSPDDMSNEDRGSDLSGKLQLEGERAMPSGWRLNGIVSHVIGHSSYWVRVRAQTIVADHLLLGPELVAQGDPLYRIFKLGAYLGGIRLGEDAALTVKFGVSKLDSDSARAYAGVEWYKPY